MAPALIEDSIPVNTCFAPFNLIFYQRTHFCHKGIEYLVLAFNISLWTYVMAQFHSFTGILNSCLVKWNL